MTDFKDQMIRTLDRRYTANARTPVVATSGKLNIPLRTLEQAERDLARKRLLEQLRASVRAEARADLKAAE